MLILADADRLGLDLDQLRQRILQPAGDGHGTAQRHIHVRELPRRILGGGVDRGAGLVHHQRAQAEFGMALDQLAGELVGLARGRAVADADQLDAVLLGQRREPGDGRIPLVLGHMRVDGVGVHHAPGAIHDRHLDAGAQAGVEADGGQSAGRRRQQQGLQVLGEDRDRLLLGRLHQTALEVQVEPHQQLDAPGLAHGLLEPGIAGPAAIT